MAKEQTWAEMDKSGIPLAKLVEGFALYNRTTNSRPARCLVQRVPGGLPILAGEDATLRDSVPTLALSPQNSNPGRPASPTTPFKKKDRPLSSAYIQRFARSLRAFSSWLYEDGYADTNVLLATGP